MSVLYICICYVGTFGLRDEGRTLRIARPVRRLQRITLQNSTRKIENVNN